MNRSIIISTLFILAGLFLALSWWYNGANSFSNQSKNLAYLEDASAPTLGDANAKAVLVEFFDPACGTCAQFAPLVKDLIKKYDPNLRLILRYAPFHENVEPVVYMLEATRAQGKFWEALDAVLKSQSFWVVNHVAQPARVWAVLEKAGVDLEALKIQMKNPEIKARIEKDKKDAMILKVMKTPSFYVNGVALERFGYEPLVELIESAL